MTRFPLLILLSLASLSLLAGCAATLQTTSLPEGVTVKTVAKIDAGAPLAVNRSGAMASVAEGSVRIFVPSAGPDLTPGTEIAKAVEATPVIALAFSPDGGRLAVVLASGGQSILRCYDLKGTLIAETSVPARVTSLAWRSERELLTTALVLKKFSFGTELASFLYRWDLKGQPAETAIYAVTIRPQLAKLPEEALYRTSSMALSPYGDEIAYTVLKDPPLFSPYLRVSLRHLDSGAEKVLAEIAIGSGGPVYTPDGESLLVGNHGGLARRLALPSGNETNAWPAQGDRIASSPSGSYLLMDGRLFQDGRLVSSLPSEATAAFLPDGSGLAVASNRGLFLVTGFKDEKPAARPGNLERILELRKLRMQGLITDAEFKARRKKVSAP